jgi:pimeloyl-ACP methyl ester carboxylesterase
MGYRADVSSLPDLPPARQEGERLAPVNEDFGLPPLRPRDVLSPVGRFLRASLPGQASARQERWADTGSTAPTMRPRGLTSGGVDALAVQAVRAVSARSVARDLPLVLAEMREALELFRERGWLTDPLSYHRTPTAPRVSTRPFEVLGAKWDRLVFDSGYEPFADEPGRERYLDYGANRQATVRVLRHAEPAPWLVLLHGSYMGRTRMDVPVFDPVRLHRELGFNVVMPVLPLHGRRAADKSGVLPTALPSLNAMDNLHGLAQAAWDVRRVLAWIRRQDDEPITVYGVSLGGYVSSLTTALLQDDPVHRVLAGIPAVDFPAVFSSQIPPRAKHTAWFQEFIANTTELHQAVSPLALPPPTTPRERLHLYAARHDRVLLPLQQATRLWQHWGRPQIEWFDGGHVLAARNKQVAAFVDRTLTS